MKVFKSLLISLFFLSSILGACELSFQPSAATVAKGGQVKVVLKRVQDHRRCELSKDDMKYDLKDLTILKKGAWKEVETGTFEQELTLRLDASQGTLRVSRECSRKGISEATITIKRK